MTPQPQDSPVLDFALFLRVGTYLFLCQAMILVVGYFLDPWGDWDSSLNQMNYAARALGTAALVAFVRWLILRQCDRGAARPAMSWFLAWREMDVVIIAVLALGTALASLAVRHFSTLESIKEAGSISVYAVFASITGGVLLFALWFFRRKKT